MNFLKRILSARPFRKSKMKPEVKVDFDAQIEELLGQARDRLDQLLAIRKFQNGVVKKTKSWTLTRSNPGLFKLEAEGLSLMIHTRPFLMKNIEGHVQGLMHLSELELSEAMQSAKTPKDFIKNMTPPQESSDQELYFDLIDHTENKNPHRLPVPEELLQWPVFDQDQMLARNSTNTLVHVMIHSKQELCDLLKSRLSVRLKKQLHEELESLLSRKQSAFMNPHTKQRPLKDYELALLEFRQSMQKYLRTKSFASI